MLCGVDAGLAAVLFVVPLWMGGRVAAGQLALAALAVWVAACWCLRQSLASRAVWVWSCADLLILAALALVVLQVAVLPPALVKALSPHLYKVLPLWAPDAGPGAALGVWSSLSLAPAVTRSSLFLFIAYAILFLVTVQRVREVQDVERILRWVAVAGSAMAAFGLVQSLTSNGKYFWLYDYPFTTTHGVPKGSFTNRNHFAHFVVLAIGPLVWWIHAKLEEVAHQRRARHGHARHARRFDAGVGFLVAVLGLCAFAVLLSLSRGGALALFVAAAVSLLVLYRGALVNGKTVLFLLGSGLLLAACLGIYGYQMVASRLDDFQSIHDLDTGNQRRDLWRANLAGIADFRSAGAGIGSHRLVYPMYLPENEISQHLEYTHAENGYLQIALEAGLPGLALTLAAIGLCGFWCLAPLRKGVSKRMLLCVAGILPSLAASVVHSLVDFVWYVPGCMVVVVLLAACACRLRTMPCWHELPSPAGIPVPRMAWIAALAGLAFLGYAVIGATWAAVRAEPGWHRFELQSRKLPDLNEAARASALEAMADELTQVLRYQPDHALAHAKLAEIHIKLFDYGPGAASMTVRQVREAALASASHFGSAEALNAWLVRAFGAQCGHLRAGLHHARRALALCPLQGDAYLSLGMVAFLDGPKAPGKEACVKQAMLVRPFDGTVLFEAGQEAMLAGNVDEALTLWRKSFQCGSLHQRHLFDVLAGTAPAAFFLESFPMDLPALKRLEARYRQLNRPEEVRPLLGPRAQAARALARDARGAEAMSLWLDAADALQQLGETAEQVECLRNAVRCDYSNYDARYALGVALCQSKQFSEAEEHVTWCLRRKPHDQTLRSLLEGIVNDRLHVTGLPPAPAR